METVGIGGERAYVFVWVDSGWETWQDMTSEKVIKTTPPPPPM